MISPIHLIHCDHTEGNIPIIWSAFSISDLRDGIDIRYKYCLKPTIQTIELPDSDIKYKGSVDAVFSAQKFAALLY